MDTSNSILFVLVLYNCKLTDSKSYNTFLKKNNKLSIYVYDNSPYKQQITLPNIKYIHNPSNPGLGTAYNTAAKYAIAKHYKWIMILDQDTTFPQNALQQYLNAINEHPSILLFAPKHKITNGKYLSPTPYYHKTSKLQNSAPTGVIKLLPYAPINSGMLINLSLFIKAGGYDEKVRLDFSDIRFIEKARKVIDTFYVVNTTCLQDYSGNETNIAKLKNRFRIFCQCAKACERKSVKDSIEYFYATFKRCMSLSIKNVDLSFITIFIQNYIL